MPFPFSYHRKLEWVRGGSRDVDAIHTALAGELQDAGLEEVESSTNRLRFSSPAKEGWYSRDRGGFGDIKRGEIQIVDRRGRLSVRYSLNLRVFTSELAIILPSLLLVTDRPYSLGKIVSLFTLVAIFSTLMYGMRYLHLVRDFNHLIRSAIRDLPDTTDTQSRASKRQIATLT